MYILSGKRFSHHDDDDDDGVILFYFPHSSSPYACFSNLFPKMYSWLMFNQNKIFFDVNAYFVCNNTFYLVILYSMQMSKHKITTNR